MRFPRFAKRMSRKEYWVIATRVYSLSVESCITLLAGRNRRKSWYACVSASVALLRAENQSLLPFLFAPCVEERIHLEGFRSLNPRIRFIATVVCPVRLKVT